MRFFSEMGGVGRICPISDCQWLLKVLERYLGLRTSNASPAQFRRCSWREVIAAAGDVVLWGQLPVAAENVGFGMPSVIASFPSMGSQITIYDDIWCKQYNAHYIYIWIFNACLFIFVISIYIYIYLSKCVLCTYIYIYISYYTYILYILFKGR